MDPKAQRPESETRALAMWVRLRTEMGKITLAGLALAVLVWLTPFPLAPRLLLGIGVLIGAHSMLVFSWRIRRLQRERRESAPFRAGGDA